MEHLTIPLKRFTDLDASEVAIFNYLKQSPLNVADLAALRKQVEEIDFLICHTSLTPLEAAQPPFNSTLLSASIEAIREAIACDDLPILIIQCSLQSGEPRYFALNKPDKVAAA